MEERELDIESLGKELGIFIPDSFLIDSEIKPQLKEILGAFEKLEIVRQNLLDHRQPEANRGLAEVAGIIKSLRPESCNRYMQMLYDHLSSLHTNFSNGVGIVDSLGELENVDIWYDELQSLLRTGNNNIAAQDLFEYDTSYSLFKALGKDKSAESFMRWVKGLGACREKDKDNGASLTFLSYCFTELIIVYYIRCPFDVAYSDARDEVNKLIEEVMNKSWNGKLKDMFAEEFTTWLKKENEFCLNINLSPIATNDMLPNFLQEKMQELEKDKIEIEKISDQYGIYIPSSFCIDFKARPCLKELLKVFEKFEIVRRNPLPQQKETRENALKEAADIINSVNTFSSYLYMTLLRLHVIRLYNLIAAKNTCPEYRPSLFGNPEYNKGVWSILKTLLGASKAINLTEETRRWEIESCRLDIEFRLFKALGRVNNIMTLVFLIEGLVPFCEQEKDNEEGLAHISECFASLMIYYICRFPFNDTYSNASSGINDLVDKIMNKHENEKLKNIFAATFSKKLEGLNFVVGNDYLPECLKNDIDHNNNTDPVVAADILPESQSELHVDDDVLSYLGVDRNNPVSLFFFGALLTQTANGLINGMSLADILAYPLSLYGSGVASELDKRVENNTGLTIFGHFAHVASELDKRVENNTGLTTFGHFAQCYNQVVKVVDEAWHPKCDDADENGMGGPN